MDTLDKQTKAARLANQAKILIHKARDLEPQIAQVRSELLKLTSMRTSLNIAAAQLNAKAIALEKEFFEELNLIKRTAPKAPEPTLREAVAALYGKETAELIADELVAHEKGGQE